jgi:predicted outer membrane protein
MSSCRPAYHELTRKSGDEEMTKFIAPALLVVTGLAAQAFAQAVTERQAPADRPAAQAPRTQPGAQQGQANQLDHFVAVCMALGHQEEITLAEFAQDRAQNPQVKQFAQTMIEEHQRALAQLKQADPQLASVNLELQAQAGAAGTTGAARAETETTRPGATPGAQPPGAQRAQTAGAQGGQQQMTEFAREFRQECLNLVTQELGRKQGAEFDKAYIGQQAGAHMAMLAEARVAQRHIQNDQLRPVIQQGEQMAEHHLAQAREIKEQLQAGGGQSPAGQAQRPETPPTPRR